ncbi:hydroxyacylglutathione hydrolase [Aureococcus anophagefferens]|nr:hydroxyacylglutathione hydrolase [Aureococcus anophagefferens]
MWEPTAVGWETSFAAPDNGPSREVATLLAIVARPPPAEARPAEAAEAPAEDTEAPAGPEPAAPPAGKVTATTATTVLALATVDLTFDDAPYWGKAAHDDDELLREDLRSTAMELLAAVAANGGGRELSSRPRRRAPAGAPAAPADAPPPDVPAAETAAATDPEAGDDGEAATPAAPAPPAFRAARPRRSTAPRAGPGGPSSACSRRPRHHRRPGGDALQHERAIAVLEALCRDGAAARGPARRRRQLAADAEAVVLELVARAAMRSLRLEARAAAGGALAYEASVRAARDAFHGVAAQDDEPKKDDKKKGKKDDKKAKDKGRKSVVEKAAEENPDEPPPVFDEAAAAAAAAVAGAAAAAELREDERGGPTLPQGADYDGRDAKLANALLYAFVAPDGAALDNALDGAREATDRGATPATLELAGDAAFVAELLEAGADVNVAVGGRFPLHWAIEGVVLELAHDGVFPCVFGFDAENRALRLGACGAATALLKAGAEPNLADAGGRLPLHLCGFRCGVEGMGAVLEALLAAGATRPRGTATYDNARAGTSRAAKMRATVGGVLDRAFAVAVAPPVISDELPLAAELLAALDAEGRTPLHCAAGAGYDEAPPPRVGMRAVADASSDGARERRGAVLAALLSRGDVSLATQSLGCAARGGAGVVHLAVEALGDFAVPALEAARAKGADLDELLELPEEDLGLQLPGFHPPEPGHDPTAPHCASPTMTPSPSRDALPPPDPSAGLVLESSAPAPAAPEVVTFDIFDTVP